MRKFIDIVEHVDLESISLESLMDYFPNSPDDIKRGWISDALNDEVFAEKFMKKAAVDIEEIKNELRSWISNPTPLYRGLKENKPPKSGKPLGVHWTNHLITAEDYANGGHILVADISPDQIDWLDTVLRRLLWKHEKEFSVKRGTPIHAKMIRGFSGRAVGEFTGTV